MGLSYENNNKWEGLSKANMVYLSIWIHDVGTKIIQVLGYLVNKGK